MKSSFLANAVGLVVALTALAGCQRQKPAGWQGYLEAEFVQVGAPLAGRLDRLWVEKGGRVQAGARLFTLEHASELAAQREAADRLRSSQARLEDLKKGLRPSELDALAARLEIRRSRRRAADQQSARAR